MRDACAQSLHSGGSDSAADGGFCDGIEAFAGLVGAQREGFMQPWRDTQHKFPAVAAWGGGRQGTSVLCVNGNDLFGLPANFLKHRKPVRPMDTTVAKRRYASNIAAVFIAPFHYFCLPVGQCFDLILFHGFSLSQ